MGNLSTSYFIAIIAGSIAGMAAAFIGNKVHPIQSGGTIVEAGIIPAAIAATTAAVTAVADKVKEAVTEKPEPLKTETTTELRPEEPPAPVVESTTEVPPPVEETPIVESTTEVPPQTPSDTGSSRIGRRKH
jgi:hypothetical protein